MEFLAVLGICPMLILENSNYVILVCESHIFCNTNLANFVFTFKMDTVIANLACIPMFLTG